MRWNCPKFESGTGNVPSSESRTKRQSRPVCRTQAIEEIVLSEMERLDGCLASEDDGEIADAHDLRRILER